MSLVAHGLTHDPAETDETRGNSQKTQDPQEPQKSTKQEVKILLRLFISMMVSELQLRLTQNRLEYITSYNIIEYIYFKINLVLLLHCIHANILMLSSILKCV